MSGDAHWFELLSVLLGGVGVILAVRLVANVRGTLLRRRLAIDCPVTRQTVACTLVEDVASGEWRDVKRCSGWRAPWRPCTKTCLKPLNDGTLREHWLTRPAR